MKRAKLILIYFSLFAFAACIKEEPVLPDEEKQQDAEEFNYTAEGRYMLNVVYFIPSGDSDIAESHRRLSEILIDGQNFFRENMKSYGFGNKTYKMMLDKGKNRVKITYLKGENSAGYYPYEGGGSKIINEVNAYFNENPSEKTSDHFLIITPVFDIGNPDVPFYGMGRYCFALDYKDFDIKYLGENSKKGRNATKYVGGLLHELGHGLNLPHSKQRKSDDNNTARGTSLMSSGNYTYGSSPTFLSKASCAILNNCQVISDFPGIFYEDVSLQLDLINAVYEDGNIKINGKISSGNKVNHVCIYNDPATDDADYDAVSWAVPVQDNKIFEVVMPVNELFQTGETPYVLRLLFTCENGNSIIKSFAYHFQNGTPVFEFGDKDHFDRSGWSVINFSSEEKQGEEDTGRAADVLDNNPATYWHSRWTNGIAANFPHFITIDMNEENDVAGISFLQRDGARKVEDIEIYISNDNQNWESVGKFDLKAINTVQHVFLPQVISFRYFKIEFLSAHDGNEFASMAEIMCF